MKPRAFVDAWYDEDTYTEVSSEEEALIVIAELMVHRNGWDTSYKEISVFSHTHDSCNPAGTDYDESYTLIPFEKLRTHSNIQSIFTIPHHKTKESHE